MNWRIASTVHAWALTSAICCSVACDARGLSSSAVNAPTAIPSAQSAQAAAAATPDRVSAPAFGVKCDGQTDDAPAINAALRSGRCVVLPPGVCALGASVEVRASECLLGSGGSTQLKPLTEAAAVRVTGLRGRIGQFDVMPDRPIWFKGVGIEVTGDQPAIDAVTVFHEAQAFVVRGGVYYGQFTNLSAYDSESCGLCFQRDLETNHAPGNNLVTFRQLNCRDEAGSAETAGLSIVGSVNLFIGGQASNCMYSVSVDGLDNRFLNIYNEHTRYSYKATGGVNYVDGYNWIEGTVLTSGARLVGPAGRKLSTANNFFARTISAEGLAALYFFDEGKGSHVFDRSGNGRTLEVSGKVKWDEPGYFGPVLRLAAAEGRILSSIPPDAIAWSRPVTIMMLVHVDPGSAELPILTITGEQGALEFVLASAYVTACDSSLIRHCVAARVMEAQESAGRWRWIAFSIDSASNKIWNLDPVHGYDFAPPKFVYRLGEAEFVDRQGRGPRLAFGSVVDVGVMRGRAGARRGAAGALAFFGLWNRKLDATEVEAVVNLATPYAPQPRPTELPIITAQPTEPIQAGKVIAGYEMAAPVQITSLSAFVSSPGGGGSGSTVFRIGDGTQACDAAIPCARTVKNGVERVETSGACAFRPYAPLTLSAVASTCVGRQPGFGNMTVSGIR